LPRPGVNRGLALLVPSPGVGVFARGFPPDLRQLLPALTPPRDRWRKREVVVEGQTRTGGELAGGAAEERLRICAEACQGIPTAELEAGILLELVAACVHRRDDTSLREIL
jgi:hypothetical protein